MGLNYHKIPKGGLWLPQSPALMEEQITEISERISKVLPDLKVQIVFKA